jgi:hypothetical protein
MTNSHYLSSNTCPLQNPLLPSHGVVARVPGIAFSKIARAWVPGFVMLGALFSVGPILNQSTVSLNINRQFIKQRAVPFPIQSICSGQENLHF